MICRMWVVYFLLLFILDHIISTLCTLILHFLFASWFYLLQVRTLLDRAYTVSKMWNDAPVILCGDFNSTPKVALVFYLSIQVMTMYCIFCAVVLMLTLTCYLMFVSFLSCLESALQFCVGAKGSIFFCIIHEHYWFHIAETYMKLPNCAVEFVRPCEKYYFWTAN